MLVLSRQRDETIMIGDDIEITVVDIRGDKVRLGITAPTRVAVHRKEVYESIKAENERAARLDGADLGAARVAPAAVGIRTRRPGGAAPIQVQSAPPTARAREEETPRGRSLRSA